MHSIETLWDLEIVRTTHRFQRFVARIRSPRQAFAIGLAVAFVALYVLAGLTILARRDTVDPGRLQLWLSGGMVCYAIYHSIKYLFAAPVDGRRTGDPATPAFGLWIGGGPLPRHIVSLHDVIRLVPATAVKASLLCVVLFRDVPSLTCLWVGVFSALFTLEWIRRLASQVVDALNNRERKVLQFAGGLVALALVGQIGIQTWNRTPRGSDPAEYMASGIGELAEFAMSTPVQWLALPLQPASHLAVCQPFAWATMMVPSHWLPLHCLGLLLGTMASLVSMLWAYVALDRWSIERRHFNEQVRLKAKQLSPTTNIAAEAARAMSQTSNRTTRRLVDRITMGRPSLASISAIMLRQWHCLVRYRFNVLISFAIPMVVSLSPLMTSDQDFAGQSTKQWIFVVGGIALSTLLLAPPALQIDFRRDLKRMWLLRSFPISSWSMCVGMLALPVLVTSLFQWITLAAAYAIAGPPIAQVFWLAMTLPALAMMTFATENALFLAFPHHIHDQGIAMVIRAKVTFLWKGLVLAMFPLLLYLGTLACVALLPPLACRIVVPVGSVVGFWSVALLSLAACVRCWTKFQPATDVPAE